MVEMEEEQVNQEEVVQFEPKKLPFHVERHLDFVDISQGGHLLLGSSNLSGKYWTGGIFYYLNPDLAPEEKWVAGHSCETGVTAGKFLKEDTVITGEDSGTLSIFMISEVEGETHFVPQMYATHHDGPILCVDVDKCTGTQGISAGEDKCINVWDSESLIAVHRYWPAHARPVTCVATAPGQESSMVFASCSLDGSALIWDSRQSKPATMLKDDKNCALTAIAWASLTDAGRKGGGDTGMIQHTTCHIGSKFGDIATYDTRFPNREPVRSIKIFDRPVHAFSTHLQSGLLAVCGDCNTVAVWDPSSNTVIFRDNEKHTGFVRGVCWHPGSGALYTCGLDRLVCKHERISNAAGRYHEFP